MEHTYIGTFKRNLYLYLSLQLSSDFANVLGLLRTSFTLEV